MRTETNPRYVQKMEATVGVCCLVMGLVAPLLGGLLTGIEWLVGGGQHPWIHLAGTAFFIAAIPLILIAGFCLDWAEKAPKRAASVVERHWTTRTQEWQPLGDCRATGTGTCQMMAAPSSQSELADAQRRTAF